MDNTTKYEIIKKAPNRIELPHKTFNNPISNVANYNSSHLSNMTDEEREKALSEIELYEGPCGAFDFGRYTNKYINAQESLIPFNARFENVIYSKGMWGKIKILVTTSDNSFTLEIDQQIYTNPNRLYVGKKMFKLGRWLKYTPEERNDIYNKYCF
jgi:hypothetical protein